MPSGYTAIIGEKDDLTFREFALICARAFGACVEMREDSLSKEIPKEFVPSDYHKREISNHTIKLQELNAMTPHQAGLHAKKEYLDARKRYNEFLAKKDALKKKYLRMLEQVKKWTPPTEDHNGLYEFMIKQIEDSIKFDCGDYSSMTPIEKSAKVWLHDAIEREIKDIAYHTKEYSEEVERVNGRNEWIRVLRESLQ